MKTSRLIKYICAAVIFFCFCLVSIWTVFLFSSTVSKVDGVQYFLRPGTSVKTLVTELSQQGIIKHPTLFSFYIRLKPQMLKTGEYLFPQGATPRSIWRQVTEGTGLVYHSFTIIPGWSFQQLRHELAQTPGLRHVSAKMEDKEVMAALGYAHLAPEGEFFPETYNYTRAIPDLVILKRAINLMQIRLSEAWHNRAPNLPYKTPYEALIAASIIEKEAYLDAERPIIAGVLVNRLKRDMLLQFDPTVIYGMGKRYEGKIHKENLLENTPYNTYVHKGLPPTPIAMPSMTSIEAALHPQATNYLYFVAKGDGSHRFSNTLPEHHVAVSAAVITSPPPKHANTSFFNESLVQKYLYTQLAEKLKKIAPSGIL